jgi:homospermidine synthase
MGAIMQQFSNRILMLGYGAVAQCTLPILLKHLKVPLSKITVMDFEDKGGGLAKYRARGLKWVRKQITPENLGSVLEKYVGPGDLLIDLAWNIDCCEILQWCHEHGVLYVNTSVEVWDPYAAGNRPPTERTLYWRHMRIRARCWSTARTRA